MRSNPKTRQLFLLALICYLTGLCLFVFLLLDSGLRLLYLLAAIVEIGGVCFSLAALQEGMR